MNQSTVDNLKKRYLDFAKFEARNNSDLYEAFTTAVAHDDRVLQRLIELPKKKQQPNLLLAAVRLKCGVAGDAGQFCNLVLSEWHAIKAIMLSRSTQTNEPARCATLLPILAGLQQPIALLEVGAAAGLCLFPDKYAYDYGDVTLSNSRELAPIFNCRANDKTPIPRALPDVCWRGGIDIHPLNVDNEIDMDWLRLLVWPEQTQRLANLERAIQLARQDPPNILKGDLINNLDSMISLMPDDATAVVFHSAVLAYLPRIERARFASHVSSLNATWISNEHPAVLPDNLNEKSRDMPADKFLLLVNGNPVAMTGPHGQTIDWF